METGSENNLISEKVERTFASPVKILILSWVIGWISNFIEQPEILHYILGGISTALFITAIIVYFKK